MQTQAHGWSPPLQPGVPGAQPALPLQPCTVELGGWPGCLPSGSGRSLSTSVEVGRLGDGTEGELGVQGNQEEEVSAVGCRQRGGLSREGWEPGDAETWVL